MPDEAPTFAAPWEAQVFAIMVKLHEDGHFDWADFAERLGAVIAAHRDNDDGHSYYRCWLEASLRLLAERDLVHADALRAEIRDVEAHRSSDHGHVARTAPVAVERSIA